jgi:glycerol-1-phosphate dehydrogenase [NAD(P)+]
MTQLGWHSLGTAFDCTCGERHELPIERCTIGESAARDLAEFAKTRCGHRALIVSDENTLEAAEGRVHEALHNLGIVFEDKTYGARPFEATQEQANIVADAGRNAEYYVAIGAGTICDLAKDAANRQNKPVLLYPTAASMNGYTSAIVALKVKGLKRTLPCKPALGVFADPAVVATAPQRMAAAGVADFLSKCSSAADWRAAHLLRGGYYCDRPREFNDGIQERLFQQANAIGQGDPEGIRLVLEALLLSGFGMVIAGSSAPASGGEHLISHYLDMKHALYETGQDLHGAQVGVATIHTLGLWEKVLAADPANLDAEPLFARQPTEDEIEASIFADWGEAVGKEVLGQWQGKRLNREAFLREIEVFKTMLPRLREEARRELQPAAVVAECIAACGGPTTPEQLTVSADEYINSVARARYLRNRFTILDLAAELGLS